MKTLKIIKLPPCSSNIWKYGTGYRDGAGYGYSDSYGGGYGHGDGYGGYPK